MIRRQSSSYFVSLFVVHNSKASLQSNLFHCDLILTMIISDFRFKRICFDSLEILNWDAIESLCTLIIFFRWEINSQWMIWNDCVCDKSWNLSPVLLSIEWFCYTRYLERFWFKQETLIKLEVISMCISDALTIQMHIVTLARADGDDANGVTIVAASSFFSTKTMRLIKMRTKHV